MQFLFTLFPIKQNIVLNLLLDLANIVPSTLLQTEQNIILSLLQDRAITVPGYLTLYRAKNYSQITSKSGEYSS